MSGYKVDVGGGTHIQICTHYGWEEGFLPVKLSGFNHTNIQGPDWWCSAPKKINELVHYFDMTPPMSPFSPLDIIYIMNASGPFLFFAILLLYYCEKCHGPLTY